MLIGNIPTAEAFPRDKTALPPFSEIQRNYVLRTQGTLVQGEMLGVGFLRKKQHNDLVNWRYPNYVLVTVLQGTGLYVDSQGLEYPLIPGSTFMRLPNLEHSNYVTEDSDYLECYLELGPMLYRALCGMRILHTASPVNTIDLSINQELLNRIWHLGWQLTYASDEEFAALTAEMIAILGEFQKQFQHSERGERHRDLVELACRELGADFQNDFSLQNFCKKHSIGYENFRKLFRTRTGMSPWDYRVRQRIECAMLLLRERNFSINEIAQQLGYNSVNEFSAQFRRKTGESPAQFRKMH